MGLLSAGLLGLFRFGLSYEQVLDFPSGACLTGFCFISEADIDRLSVPSGEVHSAGWVEGPAIDIGHAGGTVPFVPRELCPSSGTRIFLEVRRNPDGDLLETGLIERTVVKRVLEAQRGGYG